MHENIGALKQNTVSIKNSSLSGYSRHFPVLRNVFIKFLYFPGYIHLDISPLQKKIPSTFANLFILFSLSLSLFPFSQSLSQSPSILHLARTSTPFPVDARLIFPEKPRGLAPSAWPLFSHGVYLPAIRLFSPSSSQDPPSAAISFPTIQIFTKCASPSRAVDELLSPDAFRVASTLKGRTLESRVRSSTFTSLDADNSYTRSRTNLATRATARPTDCV